jgi:hypothetical protein
LEGSKSQTLAKALLNLIVPSMGTNSAFPPLYVVWRMSMGDSGVGC